MRRKHLVLAAMALTLGLGGSTAAAKGGAAGPPQQQRTRLPPNSALFRTIPHRAPGSIGLYDVLHGMRNDPQTMAELTAKLGGLAGRFGLSASQWQVVAAKAQQANVDPLMRALVQRPEDMKRFITALYQSPAAQQVGAAVGGPAQHYLPARFDLARLGEVMPQLPKPKTHLIHLAGNLYHGRLRNPNISVEKARTNLALAEVLNRLAANNHLAADATKFTAVWDGQEHGSVSSFLNALQASGHRISLRFDHQSADFLKLKIKVVQNGKQVWKSVAAPVQARTGVADAQGLEAVLPVAHSEVVIDIKPPRGGQGINASMEFYHGPGGCQWGGHNWTTSGDWVGHTTVGSVKGPQAIQSAIAASYYGAAVSEAARREGKPMGAYGLDPGVCNDSVANVQFCTKGQAVTGYPLEAKKGLGTVGLVLQEQLRKPGRSVEDGKILGRLISADKRLRPDSSRDPDRGTPKVPSARRRAGLSNGFTPENAPLVGLPAALRTLRGN